MNELFRVSSTNSWFPKPATLNPKYFTWRWRETTSATLLRLLLEMLSQVRKSCRIIIILVIIPWFSYNKSVLFCELLFSILVEIFSDCLVNKCCFNYWLTFSCHWWLSESLPGRFWDQQVQNATNSSYQTGSGSQLLRVLLRDLEQSRQGLSTRQAGKKIGILLITILILLDY